MISKRFSLSGADNGISLSNGWRSLLILLPFLLLYIAVSLFLSKDILVGDEGRYLRFADNLLHGFYSPPAPEITLWNGPGYPLFIAPFVALGASLGVLKLLNAFLLFFSLVLFYQTAKAYFPATRVMLFVVAMALYYPIYRYIPFVYTECLTWFLFALIGYLFLDAFKTPSFSWKKVLLTGLAIAFLTLTKVIFSYAVLGMIFISALVMILPPWRSAGKKSVAIFGSALIFCLPYLIYTYSITGKAFYWSDAGGMSLYTMSTPFEGEHGDWYNEDQLLANPNHAAFITEIKQLSPVERDNAYKERAIQQIKDHPAKFIDNWIRNVGRLFFFPSANAPNTLMSYYAFPINLFVVLIIVLAIGVALLQYRMLSPEMVFLLLFVLMYLGGSTLVSAYRRMFFITIPFWVLFVQYVWTRLLDVRLNEE